MSHSTDFIIAHHHIAEIFALSSHWSCVYACAYVSHGKMSYRLFFRPLNTVWPHNFYGMLVSALQSITSFNIIIVFIYIVYTIPYTIGFFDKYFRFECEKKKSQWDREREGVREKIDSKPASRTVHNKYEMSNEQCLFIYLFPSGGYAHTYKLIFQCAVCAFELALS